VPRSTFTGEVTGYSAINASILCKTDLQTGVHEFSLLHVVVVEVVDNWLASRYFYFIPIW
jgi:hypothetical protein